MDNTLLKEQKKNLAEKYADKSVLVSGSTVLIGSRIVYFLMSLNDEFSANIKIVCLYRNEEKKNFVYNELLNRDDIVFVHHSIEKEIGYKENIDCIFHCAGISGGTKMHLKDPMAVFETAYKGTKGLLDFAVKNSCQSFLFVSTYEIYGTIDSEELIKENNPCTLDTMQLRNIYSECKRMCESMCCAYSNKYGIKITVGRLTSTFGNGVNYDDPRFFAEFARCIIEYKDIVLKSTGGTVRSYLDSDDAATAFLYIASMGENMEVYNVTNVENQLSIKDIALRMIEVCDSNIQLRFELSDDISKLGFRKESCTLMDASKLYALGWKPVYSIDDTLKKLVNSMRETRI